MRAKLMKIRGAKSHFGLNPSALTRAVNMRDTGNYFVLSVLPSSAGNPLQLMRTIKPVSLTAVIILRPENVSTELNLPAIRRSARCHPR